MSIEHLYIFTSDCSQSGRDGEENISCICQESNSHTQTEASHCIQLSLLFQNFLGPLHADFHFKVLLLLLGIDLYEMKWNLFICWVHIHTSRNRAHITPGFRGSSVRSHILTSHLRVKKPLTPYLSYLSQPNTLLLFSYPHSKFLLFLFSLCEPISVML
jgi:hypothetical protein